MTKLNVDPMIYKGSEKPFCLEDFIMSANPYISYKWLDVEDIKQAIKLLKEEIEKDGLCCEYNCPIRVTEFIDQIFGKGLTE